METKLNLTNTIHEFEKTNLVSDKNGNDFYKCCNCGIKGKRRAFSESIEVSGIESKVLRCNLEKNPNIGKSIIVLINQFGLKSGEEHIIVECPESELKKYSMETWVFSENRNEPIRLFGNEYKFK
jgi:hypothetical protein